MAQDLMDVIIEEIALVDRGANRRKFLVIKDLEGVTNILVGLLKSFRNSEVTEQEVEKIQSLDAEEIKELGKALTSLQKYEGDWPDETREAVGVLLEKILLPKEIEKEDGEIEKAGARHSKETVSKLNNLKDDILKLAEAIDALIGLAEEVPEEKSEEAEKTEEPKQEKTNPVVQEPAKPTEPTFTVTASQLRGLIADGVRQAMGISEEE